MAVVIVVIVVSVMLLVVVVIVIVVIVVVIVIVVIVIIVTVGFIIEYVMIKPLLFAPPPSTARDVTKKNCSRVARTEVAKSCEGRKSLGTSTGS